MRSHIKMKFFVASLIFQLFTGCSDLQIRQPVGEVIIRDGTSSAQKIADDRAEAERALPYALIAEQTYRPAAYQNTGRPTISFPLLKCWPDCAEEEKDARKVLTAWRPLVAMKDRFGKPDGLALQIWVSKGSVCREAVIAFRGTDPTKSGNWVSNLHWFVRIFGQVDQYTQVRYNIRPLIDYIQRQPCYAPGQTVISVVGHSLGGGLAQQASYVDSRIDNVYAFDPSFVTGSWDSYFPLNSSDPGVRDRKKNAVGLEVRRIYEHGEILAYLRFIIRHLRPPTDRNPHILLIRFNVIDGNIFKQHKLDILNTCLIAEAFSKAGAEREARRKRLVNYCGDKK